MTVSQRWLLLEYKDDLLERLYRSGSNPDPYRLFDDTELTPYADHGPLLVNAAENSAIADDFIARPDDWAGLQIDSSQPLHAVLRHLRHILFVGFDSERKGVLRYSNPRTASYFFPALEEGELSIWLGPIRRLSWHSATWRESAAQQAHWHSRENMSADQWQPLDERSHFHLGKSQTEALQRQQTEKFLFHWWQQQSQLSLDQAFAYLEEGMQNGFFAADSLSTYLDIRSVRRGALPPGTLPHGSDEVRLDHLKTRLERSAADKESHA
ncbi:DUF4123 domain-containing protein [Pseudomonas guineae]|uniref:DUF4123 domain-containing protein n=1 Tax=Pseudomonas guineae TaxID=425504 RepID=UPI003D07D864